MAQNTNTADTSNTFRELFASLSEENQRQALVVLKALVFAQGAVSTAKETA